MLPYTMGNRNITVLVRGVPRTVDTSHINYQLIYDALRDQEWEQVEKLVDMKTAIQVYGGGRIEVLDDKVLYEGEPVHNIVADRILAMMHDGFDFDFMVKFLDNLMDNPSSTAVEELYLFLEANKLTITEDGCFIAYKGVRNDYKDERTGSIDNSPGQSPSMPRNKVDDRRNHTCSHGLHFGALEYASNWGPKTMVVKINPRDVVSIPHDYNNQKGRCCGYTVLSEFKEEINGSVYFTDADVA